MTPCSYISAEFILFSYIYVGFLCGVKKQLIHQYDVAQLVILYAQIRFLQAFQCLLTCTPSVLILWEQIILIGKTNTLQLQLTSQLCSWLIMNKKLYTYIATYIWLYIATTTCIEPVYEIGIAKQLQLASYILSYNCCWFLCEHTCEEHSYMQLLAVYNCSQNEQVE